jgi:DNA-binding NarL/FixJ family response regulator
MRRGSRFCERPCSKAAAVEVYKANAMRKLNLRGRTDVVRYAVLNGWLRDP